jgi:hypothetical protein
VLCTCGVLGSNCQKDWRRRERERPPDFKYGDVTTQQGDQKIASASSFGIKTNETEFLKMCSVDPVPGNDQEKKSKINQCQNT